MSHGEGTREGQRGTVGIEEGGPVMDGGDMGACEWIVMGMWVVEGAWWDPHHGLVVHRMWYVMCPCPPPPYMLFYFSRDISISRLYDITN